MLAVSTLLCFDVLIHTCVGAGSGRSWIVYDCVKLFLLCEKYCIIVIVGSDRSINHRSRYNTHTQGFLKATRPVLAIVSS